MISTKHSSNTAKSSPWHTALVIAAALMTRGGLAQEVDSKPASRGTSEQGDTTRVMVSIERLVEHTFSQLGGWINTVIQNNYLAESRPDRVKLRLYSKKELDAGRELGLLEFEAAYYPGKCVLLIPPNILEKGSAGILVHETWHALYDKKGARNGFFSDPDYTGPTYQQMEAFSKALTSKPEFQELRKNLILAERAIRLMNEVRDYANGLTRLREKMKSKFNSLLKLRESQKKLFDSLEESQRKDFAKRFSEADTKVIKFQEDLRSAQDFLNWIKSNIGSGGMPKAETLDEGVKRLGALNDQKKVYDRFFGELCILADDHRHAYKALEQKQRNKEETEVQNKIDRLEAEGKTEQAQKMRNFLKLLRDSRLDIDINSDSSGEDLGEIFEGLRSITVSAINGYQIDAILNDPNEVLARCFESIFTPYYGPVQQNRFPVTEEMLDFFSRFKFQGQPMFEGIIARARVGLSMIKDGRSPDDVTNELRGRLEFKFVQSNGIPLYFNFASLPFKIVGTIPDNELDQPVPSK